MKNEDDDCYEFDLSGVPRQNRSNVWKDALNDFFYDYDFRLPSDFASGAFKGCRAGDLKIASIKSDAMSVFRMDSQVDRDGLDAYFVLLPTSSEIALHQKGKEAIVQDKKFSLVSTSESYTYIQNDNTLFNNIIVPGQLLRSFAPRVDDAVAIASGDSVLAEMFYDFASALCMNSETIDASARKVIGQQTVELLGLLLDKADHTSRATVIQAAHHKRIGALIERDFADPGLTIEKISAALKLSIRHLQSVAAAHGTTISQMIRRRRIMEAKRLLMRRKTMRASIGSIAFQVGFSDLPHFNRVFKHEAGCSPSEFTL